MTTTDIKVLHSRAGTQERAIRGVHAPLILTEAPAGNTANLDKPLVGLTLTVDGDYYCLIPIGGLTGTLTLYLTATLDSMTCTPTLDAVADFNPRVTNVADATVITTSSDDGVGLTTTVESIVTLAIGGTLYARLKLVLAGTPTSVVFTRAEYVSL
jgi:hypothetical protein